MSECTENNKEGIFMDDPMSMGVIPRSRMEGYNEVPNAVDNSARTVCGECPHRDSDCYLSRGVMCMGPIAYDNCNAYCINAGLPCKGCHSALVTGDALLTGLGVYKEVGFTQGEIMEAAKEFSANELQLIKEAMEKIF